MHLDKRGLVLSAIGKPIQYKGDLLLRLGGRDDLFAIMTTLCIHLQNDPQLSKYYGAYKVEDLRLLIIDFFNAALLLDFPRGFDLKQHIAITQYHQLSIGMGAGEFDMLIQAFRKAFSDEPIPDEVVEEVIQYIATLRIFFDDEKMRQRAKKIASSIEAEQEADKEISVHSGHDDTRIRSWSKSSKGRRRKLNNSPAHSSEPPEESSEQPIRRTPRRGSLQYRIRSVMPIRRISVPKENDKDPGTVLESEKKRLDHKSSPLSSSRESAHIENARGSSAGTSRSPSRSSRLSKSARNQDAANQSNQQEARKPPTGSFSFSHSRDANTKPIRRMPRRGSLQYRIKSVMPARRISAPKENDQGHMVLKQAASNTSDQKDPTPLPPTDNGFTNGRIARNSAEAAPSRNSNLASSQDVASQSNQQETTRKAPTGSFSFSHSRDAKPTRRTPRRGSLQYRIKSVMPARRISAPKENDIDPGQRILKPAASNASDQKDPTPLSATDNGFTDGRIARNSAEVASTNRTGSNHSREASKHNNDQQSSNVPDQPARRMRRRGSLQYRIKSVLPVRRISVPKENDKDPGLVEPIKVPTKPGLETRPSLQSRPSLARSTDSKASMLSGSNRTTRGSSPHGRFFTNVMRRIGNKEKRNANGGDYSCSDDDDEAPFVSSEELEDEPKPQELQSSTIQASDSYKTSKPQEPPRRSKAYVEQANGCGGPSDLIRSSSWENALVL